MVVYCNISILRSKVGLLSPDLIHNRYAPNQSSQLDNLIWFPLIRFHLLAPSLWEEKRGEERRRGRWGQCWHLNARPGRSVRWEDFAVQRSGLELLWLLPQPLAGDTEVGLVLRIKYFSQCSGVATVTARTFQIYFKFLTDWLALVC